MMLATAFLVYVAASATLLCGILWLFLPRRQAAMAIGSISAWLAYAGMLGGLGVVSNTTTRPPGIALLVLPIFVFIAIVIVRSRVGLRLALAVPLAVLVGLQSFRIGVELFIQCLHDAGLAPRLMTLEGGNVELLIALSAPAIAWFATRGSTGRRLTLGWSILGLTSLANIAVRSVFTAPGPLHVIASEVPNVAMGMFPFTFIPGFLAPLAVALHVLAIRAILTAATRRGVLS